VPGSPLDPRAKGTNQLLKNGAILLEDATDVISALKQALLHEPTTTKFTPPPFIMPSESELKAYRSKLLTLLDSSELSLDDLHTNLNIPINILNVLILELELAGKIERLFGNNIKRIF
jgi:DNA processing protein